LSKGQEESSEINPKSFYLRKEEKEAILYGFKIKCEPACNLHN
jgi:hypothetical protein